MPNDIRTELKQKKAFACQEEELFLNIIRTADQLQRKMAEIFSAHDLSRTQYNVLRILRGAGEKGLACGEISERMITRDPDITRLLDRMEKRSHISRAREKLDRRVVTAKIEPPGLELLKRLDGPITQLHRAQLGHIDSKQQIAFIRLLETAREKIGGDGG